MSHTIIVIRENASIDIKERQDKSLTERSIGKKG